MPRLSISAQFDLLRQRKQIALMPFVPAGYPDLATTAAVLPAIEAAGASLIEIGIPFSDPIADGPTIQAAFTEALAKKLKVADVLRTVAAVRPKVSIPLVAMLSYSIVYRYGLERFLKDAKSAGFDKLFPLRPTGKTVLARNHQLRIVQCDSFAQENGIAHRTNRRLAGIHPLPP